MRALACRVLISLASALCALLLVTPAFAFASGSGATDVTVIAMDGNGDGNIVMIVPVPSRSGVEDCPQGLAPTSDTVLPVVGLLAAAGAAAGAAGALAWSRKEEKRRWLLNGVLHVYEQE